MGKEIEYQWVSDGNNVEVSSINIPDIGLSQSGYADLVNGKVVIENYFSGNPVILTRTQDNTSGFGHLYVYTPNTINNVSFEIRSSNTADNGTIYWEIVAE